MDWKLLIAELQAAGLSQARIAKECRCAQATVSDLACGTTKEPRYSIGEALHSLRRKHGRAKADVVASPTTHEAAHV